MARKNWQAQFLKIIEIPDDLKIMANGLAEADAGIDDELGS